MVPTSDAWEHFVGELDTLTLANLTDRMGATYGARTAFVLETPLALPGTTDTTVSFADLATLVRRATDAILRLGVRRGDRVVLCTRNRMELAVAEWAVVRAGAVAVPMGARLPADQILRVIADAGAHLLIADRWVLDNPLRASALPGIRRL